MTNGPCAAARGRRDRKRQRPAPRDREPRGTSACVSLLTGGLRGGTDRSPRRRWSPPPTGVDSLRTMEIDRPGGTRDTAIVVGSHREEYEWLHEHYPGHTLALQHVVEDGAITFDVVTLRTDEGLEFEVHFDITSFYSKDRLVDYDEDYEEEDKDK